MKLTNSYENGFKNFLFYDIEVFKEDTLIVFKDINGLTDKVFHNDFNGLGEYISGKVLVGYNNYHYDDYILSACIMKKPQYRIKGVNDDIIERGKTSQNRLDWITSLDCFQQINVAKPSLKRIEANLGMSIDETQVPFDIDRALTDEEYQLTLRYCQQDVSATIEIFKLRWFTYFVPKLSIIEMLPEDIQNMATLWNTTTITGHFLTDGKQIPKWFDYKLPSEEVLEGIKPNIPKEVFDMWYGEKRNILFGRKPEVKQTVVRNFGCEFIFGFGGLHGVNLRRKKFKNVKLLDVASMYPNIIKNLTGLGKEATSKYVDIVERRLEAKHNNDTATANALKLVVNSAYGLMKNEYSKLYNPIGATSVCLNGQIALYDLCKRLYDSGYEIVNVNTDGVAFTGIGNKSFEDIQKGWEKDYNLELELSNFTKWVQKDVNNYVAQTKYGAVKVKGGDVKKFNDPHEYKGNMFDIKSSDSWTNNNSLAIIDRAVVDYVLNDVPPEYTVQMNRDKPLLFQFMLQSGRTFKGTFDNEGNEYQKVNRVFATKGEGVYLHKQYEDGRKVKFPNAPDHQYVYNQDLRTFVEFEDIVDLLYYQKLAREVCDRWDDGGDSPLDPVFLQFF